MSVLACECTLELAQFVQKAGTPPYILALLGMEKCMDTYVGELALARLVCPQASVLAASQRLRRHH